MACMCAMCIAQCAYFQFCLLHADAGVAVQFVCFFLSFGFPILQFDCGFQQIKFMAMAKRTKIPYLNSLKCQTYHFFLCLFHRMLCVFSRCCLQCSFCFFVTKNSIKQTFFILLWPSLSSSPHRQSLAFTANDHLLVSTRDLMAQANNMVKRIFCIGLVSSFLAFCLFQ